MEAGREEIRAYFNAAGWDDLITECMGGQPAKKEKGGEEWVYKCFGHEDTNPSLRINHATGLFHCPVCGVGGDGFELWNETHSSTFPEACNQIGEMIGLGAWTTTSTTQSGITMETLAEAKGFVVNDLEDWGVTETSHSGHPAVRIPYLDETGKEITYSLRISLDEKPRFWAPAGRERELYGLNWLPIAKEQDRVIFVEGESDCWTCWIHGIPAIGIPGASGWKEEWSGLFQDISSVFVIKEPDQGGTTLAIKLQKAFGKRLRVADLPAKDANELYLQDRENFLERLEKYIQRASCPSIRRPPSLKLSDLNAMADVNWLWDEWIPKGALTLVVGETGVGKSFLSCYFIACATGVLNWPNSAAIQRHRVCLLETESMRAEHGRRLQRMGMREDSSDLVLPYREGDQAGEWYVPRLPEDLKELVEPYVADGSPWVVVVDSLSGAHQLKENDSEMRSLLQALSGFAAKHDVAVIAAHHLNKSTGQHGDLLTLNRVRGSSTIAQFSRSVIGLEEVTKGGPILVHSLKSTFAKKPEAFGFLINEEGILEICDPPEVKKSRLKKDFAAEFLKSELSKHGPMKPCVLLELAEEKGIKEPTLRRARDTLGVISEGGEWVLPSFN